MVKSRLFNFFLSKKQIE